MSPKADDQGGALGGEERPRTNDNDKLSRLKAALTASSSSSWRRPDFDESDSSSDSDSGSSSSTDYDSDSSSSTGSLDSVYEDAMMSEMARGGAWRRASLDDAKDDYAVSADSRGLRRGEGGGGGGPAVAALDAVAANAGVVGGGGEGGGSGLTDALRELSLRAQGVQVGGGTKQEAVGDFGPLPSKIGANESANANNAVKQTLPRIFSAPNTIGLESIIAISERPMAASGTSGVVIVEQGLPTATSVSAASKIKVASDPDAHISPSDYLQSLLRDAGYGGENDDEKPLVSASDAGDAGYFVEYTPEQISSYDMEVTAAVRAGDVPALRSMLRKGRDLQCSNRFGESILHAACRRGSLDVVRFLLDEAGVSLRVRDDQGRTPLHDACWTREPDPSWFELVRTIVQREPDLLVVCDRRGHTPLGYVRRDDWGAWVRFLDGHRNLLAPKVLLKPKRDL